MNKSILGIALLLTAQAHSANGGSPANQLERTDTFHHFNTDHHLHHKEKTVPIPAARKPYRTQNLSNEANVPENYTSVPSLMSQPQEQIPKEPTVRYPSFTNDPNTCYENNGKHYQPPGTIASTPMQSTDSYFLGTDKRLPSASAPPPPETATVYTDHQYDEPYGSPPMSKTDWVEFQAFKRQQVEQARAGEKAERNAKELEAFKEYRKQHDEQAKLAELQAAKDRVSPTISLESKPPKYNIFEAQISLTDKTLPFVAAAIKEGNSANENLGEVMQSLVIAVKELAEKRDSYKPPATDSQKSRNRLRSIKPKGTSVEEMMKAAKKEQKGKDSYLRKEAGGVQRTLATLMICSQVLEDCKRKTDEELLRDAGLSSEV